MNRRGEDKAGTSKSPTTREKRADAAFLCRTDESEDGDITLDFAAEQAALCGGGWLQGRYYEDDGDTVRALLSFDSVFGICPFEVGVNRRPQRKKHRETLEWITPLLELEELMPRAFSGLSNGEMRRVLFARAVLARPRRLRLVSPMEGLDPARRAAFARAMDEVAKRGVSIDIVGEERPDAPAAAPKRKGAGVRRCTDGGRPDAPAVIEMNGVTLRFGRRTLLKDFSWTVREGERWVLRGSNGSGKTTLLALITGDSPLAYAYDVKVFGIPREVGCGLSGIRRRIAAVSPEMQAYLGKTPEELVEEALAREPRLLLLDEPCCNLGAASARRIIRRIGSWLRARPQVTAVCVAHRAHDVPAGFHRVLDLGE